MAARVEEATRRVKSPEKRGRCVPSELGDNSQRL